MSFLVVTNLLPVLPHLYACAFVAGAGFHSEIRTPVLVLASLVKTRLYGFLKLYSFSIKEHKKSQMYQLEREMMDLNDEQQILANRASKTHNDLVNRIREVSPCWY